MTTSTGLNLPTKELVVVSPDVGSIKRARGHAVRLNAALSIVDKRRASAEQTKQENLIGAPIEGKICLMFDDMISTAGSICGAARVLADRGAKEIYVAASHGVLCGAAIETHDAGSHSRSGDYRFNSIAAGPDASENQGTKRGPPSWGGDQANSSK